MARLSAICGNTATVNSGLFLAYSNFMDYKGFAGRLKALQIECDAPKTQYKFAEWLGLSKSFVSELLRGEKLPSMDLAIILSDKFDVVFYAQSGFAEMNCVHRYHIALLRGHMNVKVLPFY